MKKLFAIIAISIALLLNSCSESNNKQTEKLCLEESQKSHPDRVQLQKYCIKAAEQYQQENSVSTTTRYYLLAGEYEKNLNVIQNNPDSYTAYSNIAHSYVLSGKMDKATVFYKKFLQNVSISWAGGKIDRDYKLLNKLYPEQKKNLQKGIKIWYKIYTPYGDLRTKYKQAKKSKQYKDAIGYLSQLIEIQKGFQNKDNMDIWESINLLGILYYYNKEYEKSLLILDQIEKLDKKKIKNFFVNYVELFQWMGEDHIALGDYNKAIYYFEKALKFKKTLYTENTQKNINFAKLYQKLSFLYKKIGDSSNAKRCYEEASSIEENYAKKDAEIVNSFNKLGTYYRKKGNNEESLKYYKMADTSKKMLAGIHSDKVTDYVSVLPYKKLVALPALLKRRQQGLLINQKVHHGEEYADTAVCYHNLGSVYDLMGDYKKALENYQKSLIIRKKILTEKDPNIIKNLISISEVYYRIGNYPKSMTYARNALELTENTSGKKNIDTASIYNIMATLNYSMGDYKNALEYYQKALLIQETVFGKADPITANTYINIGIAYIVMGDYPQAMKYLEKALLIKEKILGTKHPDTAHIYVNISIAYKAMKSYLKALEYSEKALVIRKTFYGEEHPSTATDLNTISWIYRDKGDYPKALNYAKKALGIREKVLGKDHSSTAVSYRDTGSLYQKMQDYTQAYAHASLAFDIFLKNRGQVFTILDSEQKEKYLKANTSYITSLLSSAYQYIQELKQENKTQEIQEILQSGINAWLNYKGSIFDSENAIAMLYSSTKDKKIKVKINDLISSKRYLAKLYQSLPKPKERDVWQKDIKATEEKISSLTNQLSSKARNFKEQQGLKSITYRDITSYLKEDELYIDYAKMGDVYYLFTLNHDEKITFSLSDANNTKKIDTLVKEFREDINTILTVKNLTDEKLKRLTESSKEKLSKLYELIIKQPLNDTIDSRTSLIISPDGALRLLPFETLYNKESDKYFIEEKEIRYIPSGKELVRLYKYSKDKVNKKQSAVIFANPNFDTKITSASKEQITITPNTNRSGIIKSLFRMRFAPLPGTKAEAKAIKETLKKNTVSEYQDNNATESTLMKVKELHILHIATHGFFINDNTIPNPMLKSGIALAGANASAIQGKSDGIVTALKLSGLDLKGTDLVVLSACQTGVVDINATDSVSGLSKAFIQAGTKDIIISLWSVDDEATKKLMTSFYQEMKANKNYAKALKAAKLKMIKEGRHPFYWAAFVVNGL